MANIIVVDEHDEVLGVQPRDLVDETHARYRVTALWVLNSKKEILLARRALTKTHSPGKWGCAVAGTVEEGETYESNIAKETAEELGLRDVTFALGPKVKRDGKHKFFAQWFTITWDGDLDDLTLQTSEVDAVKWISSEDLERELRDNSDEYLASLPAAFDVMRTWFSK